METNRRIHRINKPTRHYHEQSGLSVLLFLLVLMLFAIAMIFVARVVPIYFEFYNVKSSLESLQKENKSDVQTEQGIRAVLKRRFHVNDVKSVAPNNIRVEKLNKSMLVSVQYDVRKPLIANISIVIDFSAKSEIPL